MTEENIGIQKSVGELIDVYDRKYFEKTGVLKVIKTLPKKVIHETGAFHLAGHVWIYNSKGEILLQKRAREKDSNPGLWDISAAGHISAGEDMITGIIRELKEELGIDISGKESCLQHSFDFIKNDQKSVKGKKWYNREFNSVFVLCYDGDIESLVLQKEEVDEVKFIPLEQYIREIADSEISIKYALKKPEYYQKIFQVLGKVISR